jgi:hypothetical protein
MGTQATGKCSKCGSRLRAGETWCSLCYQSVAAGLPQADWASPVSSGPVSPQPPPSEPPSSEPLSSEFPSSEPWPSEFLSSEYLPLKSGPDLPSSVLSPGSVSAAPGAAARALDPGVIAVAERLLAELAAAEARSEENSALGSLHARMSEFGGRGGGALLAVVGGTVLLVVTILGMTLLGLLL